MNRPIILWDTGRHTSQTSDDAGTTISKLVHPPAVHQPGPYDSQANVSRVYVPSLTYFALKALFEYPEQIHFLGSIRLRYQSPSSLLSYNVLRELIPLYDPNDPNFNLSAVDPRLWATLIQVFADLPDTFRTYRIPLSDKHVPLLQQIPSSPHFSLITILELPGCPELTDNTIVELRYLSSLGALDASETAVSAYGVKNLSRTLMWSEGDHATIRERRGPWAIRIFNLRNCKNVDNGIFSCLPKFVLLSVIDLRGTQCNPRACDTKTFRPSNNKSLFHPSPLSSSLSLLSSGALSDSPVFSSPDIYTLHITSLSHRSEPQLGYSSFHGRRQERHKPSVSMQDAYVVLPPSQSYTKMKKEPAEPNGVLDVKPKIKVGNSHTLEHRRLRREEIEQHHRNKEAWYEKNGHSARAWPGGLGGPDYEDPYGDGDLRWSIDEEDALGDSEDESEDGSEDDDLDNGLGGMKLDPSQSIWLRADANGTTPTTRRYSDTSSYVSAGASSEEQLPTTYSHISSPALAGRPNAIPHMPESQPVSHGYQRQSRARARARARARLSDILPYHPVHDVLSGAQQIMIAWNDASNHSESNRHMALAARQEQLGSSIMRDGLRTQLPEASLPVRDLIPMSQPGTSHPISPTTIAQPSRPGFDIQTSIASEEADIYTGRQATAAFYLHTAVSTAASASCIRRRLSGPLHQSRGQTGVMRMADEPLMLFRDPPPWSTLESSRMAPASRTKGKQCAQETAAVLGRSNTVGVDGVRELLQMVKRRKLSDGGPVAKVSNQPGVATHTMPRNPFRSNLDSKVLANTSGQKSVCKNTTSSSKPSLATVPSKPQFNSMGSGSAKPCKPISKLAMPALPTEKVRLAETKSGVQVSLSHKGRLLDGDGHKRAPTSQAHATNISVSKEVLKKTLQLNSESKPGSQGPLPDLFHSIGNRPRANRNAPEGPRISIKSSDNMSSRKPRSVKGPTAFDWKGWSGK